LINNSLGEQRLKLFWNEGAKCKISYWHRCIAIFNPQQQSVTGNDLVLLSNVHSLPEIEASFHDDRMKNIFQYYAVGPEEMGNELHIYAKELLAEGEIKEAWQVLLTVWTGILGD
jgi:hypothetical protein